MNEKTKSATKKQQKLVACFAICAGSEPKATNSSK